MPYRLALTDLRLDWCLQTGAYRQTITDWCQQPLQIGTYILVLSHMPLQTSLYRLVLTDWFFADALQIGPYILTLTDWCLQPLHALTDWYLQNDLYTLAPIDGHLQPQSERRHFTEVA